MHVWAMNYSTIMDKQYRSHLPYSSSDRASEIFLPLKIIANLSADQKIIELLERKSKQLCMEKVETFDPTVLLSIAIKTCISEGYTNEIALPFLQLQIAALIENNLNRADYSGIQPVWRSPQWIGNAIENLNLREKSSRVRRARLYGKETRIYKLSGRTIESVMKSLTEKERIEARQPAKSPFSFCETLACASCTFVNICEETVPGLNV